MIWSRSSGIWWMFVLAFVALQPMMTVAKWLQFIQPLGRTVSDVNDQTLLCDWPLCGIHFQVVAEKTETKLEIDFHSTTGECSIVIEVNCERKKKIFVNGQQKNHLTYRFPTQTNHTYDITVRKANEPYIGVTKYKQLTISGAQLVPPEHFQTICNKTLKFLALGDSITAGYGTEGRAPCNNNVETQDATHTYAEYLSQQFHAELHMVACSGRGIVHSVTPKGIIQMKPFPEVSNRIVGVEENNDAVNYWDPNRYQPDLIMILLGLSDFLFKPYPTNFDEAFTAYMKTLQQQYPHSKFLMIYDPIYHTTYATHCKTVAHNTGVRLIHLHRTVMTGGVGCNFHPNAASHKNIAAALKPVIEELLSNHTSLHHGHHHHKEKEQKEHHHQHHQQNETVAKKLSN